MHAHFDRTVTLHVVDLQGSRDEHALGVTSTDVIFDAFRKLLAPQRDATLVMVELNVVRKQAVELFQVAMIVGVEDLAVEFGNGFVEISLIFDFVK